jgi:hypothetical protein
LEEEEAGVEEVHQEEVGVVVQEADHPVEWEAEEWGSQEVDHQEAEVVIHSRADLLVQVVMALQVSMDLANTNSPPGKRKHVERAFDEWLVVIYVNHAVNNRLSLEYWILMCV